MVTAGRTETFQEFLGSLGLAEREVISESYLHFLMAEQAWQSQVPDFKLGEKGVGVVSKRALVRLRGRNAQTKKVDRMSLGRKYIGWLDDRVKTGKLSDKIHCHT